MMWTDCKIMTNNSKENATYENKDVIRCLKDELIILPVTCEASCIKLSKEIIKNLVRVNIIPKEGKLIIRIYYKAA